VEEKERYMRGIFPPILFVTQSSLVRVKKEAFVWTAPTLISHIQHTIQVTQAQCQHFQHARVRLVPKAERALSRCTRMQWLYVSVFEVREVFSNTTGE